MITTGLLLDIEQSIWHKAEGFAKTEKIAKWLFAYCGWEHEYPKSSVLILREEIDWPESEKYFPSEKTEVWVLGDRLFLN